VIQKLRPILKRLGLLPTALVDSGWGSHLYWFLDAPLKSLDAGERANRILAELCDGDTAAANAAHPLRLPGSMNCKGSVPRECSLRYYSDNVIYSTKGILALLEDIESRISKSRKSKSAVESVGKATPIFPEPSMSLLHDLLFGFESPLVDGCPIFSAAIHTPRLLGYHAWFALACTFASLFGSSGAQLFHELSRLDPVRYDMEQCEFFFMDTLERKFRVPRCEKIPEGSACQERFGMRCTRGLLGRIRYFVTDLRPRRRSSQSSLKGDVAVHA
jgi:hypothetical protein